MRITLCLMLAAVAGCSISRAPDDTIPPRPLAKGARARVHAPAELLGYTDPSREVRVGTVVSVTSDTMTLYGSRREGVVAVPASGVQRLYVSTGKAHPVRGAVLGGLAGVLAAVAVATKLEDKTGSKISGTTQVVVGVGTGLLVGSIVGVLGAGGERWVPSSFPARGSSPRR